jgi:ribonuclease Z
LRFRPVPPQDRESRATGRLEMEQQSHEIRALMREAGEAWGPRKAGPPPIFAASDFYTFHVPLRVAPAAGAGAVAEAEGGESGGVGGKAQPPVAAPAAAQRGVSGGRLMPRRQVR